MFEKWSGREDSNLRPPAPEAGALPGCATPRHYKLRYGEDAAYSAHHAAGQEAVTAPPTPESSLSTFALPRPTSPHASAWRGYFST